jgi:hypothetical protein
MLIPTDHSDVPLAIIGMACRLPGADNIEQYWRLIVEGRSSIGEVPAERFDQQLYYDPAKGVRGKSYSKLVRCQALPDRRRSAEVRRPDASVDDRRCGRCVAARRSRSVQPALEECGRIHRQRRKR